MKLKQGVSFEELEKCGFVEDPVNCEFGDTYYGSNNYFYEFKQSYGAEFRLVVNMHTGEFEILAMTGEYGLIQLCDLDIIVKLIKDGLIE